MNLLNLLPPGIIALGILAMILYSKRKHHERNKDIILWSRPRW